MRQLIILSLLLTGSPLLAEEFTAKLVGLTDGDTIRVLRDKEEITIRLKGIDFPESKQAFGSKAKQAASELAFGQTVTVKATGNSAKLDGGEVGRVVAELAETKR